MPKKIFQRLLLLFLLVSPVLVSAESVHSRKIFEDQWDSGWNKVFFMESDSVLLLVNTQSGDFELRRGGVDKNFSILRKTQNTTGLTFLEHLTFFNQYNLFYFLNSSENHEGTCHFYSDTGILKMLHNTLSQSIWTHAEPFNHNGQFVLLYNSGTGSVALKTILNPRLGLYESIEVRNSLPQGLDNLSFYTLNGDLYIAAVDTESQKIFCFKAIFEKNRYKFELVQSQKSTDKFSLIKTFSMGKRQLILFYSRNSGIAEIHEIQVKGKNRELIPLGSFSWFLNADSITLVPSSGEGVNILLLSSNTGFVKVYHLEEDQ